MPNLYFDLKKEVNDQQYKIISDLKKKKFRRKNRRRIKEKLDYLSENERKSSNFV